MATVRTRIGPKDRGRRMTLAEFREAEWRSGFRYELARGVLEVTNIPGDAHWQVIHNLHELFSDHLRRYPRSIRRIGHGSEVEYIVPELETGRHPDIAILFYGTPAGFEGRPLPVLGVEVVSRGARSRKRDYIAKKEEYLAVGLLEYWIVDPKDRRVTVLSRVEIEGVAAWQERIFRGDEVIASGLLPGFAGTVAELWGEIDEL